jgi:hypothetical protein
MARDVNTSKHVQTGIRNAVPTLLLVAAQMV